MKVKITYTKDSPFYRDGEENIVYVTEIHYNYRKGYTAFEDDNIGTGFTLENKYIQEFEVLEDNKEQCYE